MFWAFLVAVAVVVVVCGGSYGRFYIDPNSEYLMRPMILVCESKLRAIEKIT